MHLNEFNNNGDDYHFGIPHRYSTHYLLLEALREQLKIKPGILAIMKCRQQKCQPH